MLVLEGKRCTKCSSYRRSLLSRMQRLEDANKENVNLMTSKRKHMDMPKELLIRKIKQQRTYINTLEHEVNTDIYTI